MDHHKRKAMKTMEYVNFGSAGVKVSHLAFGLGFRGQKDEAEAQRVIEHALDLGINLIDCANIYGPTGEDGPWVGHSETILGKALKGRRDEVVITTKAAGPIGSGPNDQGVSRFHLMREVERSLRRLDTDHIDVYLMHDFDPSTPLEETVRALDDLVRSGKVRYPGCCNYAAWQVCKALWIADDANAAPYICVQNPYSLLNRRIEGEMFGLVRDRGLGVMAYSPLAIGLLSGAYRADAPAPPGSLWSAVGHRKERFAATMRGQVSEVVSTLHDLAAEAGRTPAQLALAWVLSHPEVTTAISGSDRVEHLDDVVGCIGWTLEDSLRRRLDEVSSGLGLYLDG